MNTTQPLEITPERRQKLQAGFAAAEDLAARYEQDPALRARIDSGDIHDSLAGLGVSLPAGVEAKIVVNTADTFHFILPPDPNVELSEEMLTALGGGKTAATAGTAGTMATFGGTVSTVMSAGSAGSFS